MKLRLKGNTVRLRLSKTEVEKLSSDGMVEEQTVFTNTAFVYRLKKDNGSGLKADLNNSELTVYIPDSFVNDWPGNTVVGLDNRLSDGTLPGLYILVEKDFKCIDDSTEDQSDNFDNPKTC